MRMNDGRNDSSGRTPGEKLPVWRLISGLGVLGLLLLVAMVIAPVYIANYRLTQYVRTLAAQPDANRTPDETFRAEIADRAHELHLPLHPADITVKHEGGRVQLQVANYKAQVYHADLHFSGIRTR
jgi:hypothetical protein